MTEQFAVRWRRAGYPRADAYSEREVDDGDGSNDLVQLVRDAAAVWYLAGRLIARLLVRR
jgi:hypothetical protein